MKRKKRAAKKPTRKKSKKQIDKERRFVLFFLLSSTQGTYLRNSITKGKLTGLHTLYIFIRANFLQYMENLESTAVGEKPTETIEELMKKVGRSQTTKSTYQIMLNSV